MIFKKISKFLFILGVISLIYWPKVYSGNSTFLPLRFELIFALSLVFALIYFIGRLISKKPIMISKKGQELTIVFSFFFISILLATAISYFRYNLFFDVKGIFAFIKIIIGFLLFALAYIFLKKDSLLYKKLSWAFYLPPLIFIPFLFFPTLINKFSVISGGFRFRGLASNPGQLAQGVTIAFSFLFVLTIYHYYRKQLVSATVYGALSASMIALVFWSQMRTYVISIIGVIIIANFLVGAHLKKKQLKTIFAISLGMLLVCLIFLSLSPTIRTSIFGRISFANGSYALYDKSQEPRFATWKYYSALIPKNILGIGLNFEQRFFVRWFLPNGDIWQLTPHSILDLWVYSGVLGSFAIFYLLWKSLIQIKSLLKKQTNKLIVYRIGAWTALVSLWIASFFNGSPIFYPGFWILLAMSLV